MATINLLSWREELREKRKKEFIAVCVGVAVLGVVLVALAWSFYNQRLNEQEQANQLIISANKNLDTQLKSLDGLQERRNAIIDRMNLIQGLQGKRPVAVRLIDEIVRVTPKNMYLTKFSRTGDKFTLEGRAESPNTVAEFLRNLEASPWYRNAFMNSYMAPDDKAAKPVTSVVPRVEEGYGSFVVTADLDQIGLPGTAENKPAVAPAAATNNSTATANNTTPNNTSKGAAK